MSVWDNHWWTEALSIPHGTTCPGLMLMVALDVTTCYQHMWSQRALIKTQTTSEHTGFTEKKLTLAMQRGTASWVEDKKKAPSHESRKILSIPNRGVKIKGGQCEHKAGATL